MKAFLATIAPSIIDNVLGPLLIAGLTWASIRLAGFIKAHTKNARVQGILLRLNDATFTAVSSLEQTVVAAAKASSASGKMTNYTGQCVKAAALESLRSHLGAKGIAELKAVLGVKEEDLDSFLAARIESNVLAMPSKIAATQALSVPTIVVPRGQDPDSVNTPAKPVPAPVSQEEDITTNIRGK